MKRYMLAILFATTFALSSTSHTQALQGTGTSASLATITTIAREEPRTTTTGDDITEQKRLELEAKKQQMEQKVAEKRAAISEKLLGARAERCKAKQANINVMLDTRVAAAQKHFDTFKSIQDKLTTFVQEKELTVDNNNALKVIMDGLQLIAQSNIVSLGSTTDFSCDTADASAPGAIIKDQLSIAKQSLKDYRDSIKDYAVAIKASVEQPAETPAQQPESMQQTTEEVQQ